MPSAPLHTSPHESADPAPTNARSSVEPTPERADEASNAGPKRLARFAPSPSISHQGIIGGDNGISNDMSSTRAAAAGIAASGGNAINMPAPAAPAAAAGKRTDLSGPRPCLLGLATSEPFGRGVRPDRQRY